MPVSTLIVLFLAAFLVSGLTVPLIYQVAARKGLFDIPTTSRKIHKIPVPRLGGISIFLSLFIVSIAFARLTKGIPINFGILTRVFGVGGLIFLIGVYDDLRGLNAPRKFLAQFIALAIFWLIGFRLEIIYLPWIGGFQIHPVQSFVLTTIGIAGFINAMNLIDGIDELASGVTIIAASTLAVMRSNFHDPTSALLAIVLSGATLGFMCYNLHPAPIFMGDSGAMVIGFIIGFVSLTHFNAATSTQDFWLPTLILAVPIMELCTTIIRRLKTRKAFYSPDGEHMHHKLLSIGMTSQQTSGLLYGTTFLFSVMSLIMSKTNSHFDFVVVLLCYILSVREYRFLTTVYKSRSPNVPEKEKIDG